VIWQNPWALLGLLAVAVPVLIHLLGRDKAPRHSFPSLRFIEIAELPPTRRTRLHDLLLLATRVLIFAVAAAALAQPLVLVASRRAAIDSRLARAIIVDTSASMQRPTPSAAHAVDSARSAAKRLAGDAQTSISIETNTPSLAIGGAVAWLESQPSRREIVIVSDFQTGALDSVAVAAIPTPIGLRAVPISTTGNVPLERRNLLRDASVIAHIDVATNPTVVSWTLGARADSARSEPRITLDATDRSLVEALMAGAKTLGVAAPIDSSLMVTVVFPSAADRDALMKRATRVSSQRLTEIVSRLLADSLIGSPREFAMAPVARASSGDSRRLGPTLMSVAGSANAIAAEDTVGGAHRLLVFSYDSVANVNTAMLIAAIRRASSTAPSIRELDPSTTPKAVIDSWQRAPSATPTRETVDSTNGPSDARWLWLVVLALLGAEAMLRRDRPAVAIRREEQANDRAA